MNYIKHLTGFFEKVAIDKTLNPTHISLYIALFQFWNCNRFRNPISISRDEIMRISKISSKATYHKCLKNLHFLGYIKYEPSYNPFRGSHVYMFNFSDELKPLLKKERNESSFFEPTNEQVVNKKNTSSEIRDKQAQVPSINNTNNTNNKNESKPALPSQLENQKVTFLEEKKEKSSAKKEKAETTTNTDNEMKKEIIHQKPPFAEVFNHFIQQDFEIAEAQKFYNYYESNGWLIGGKTPMVDWQAAAQNWMQKTKIFNQTPNTTTTKKTNHLNTTTDKDYSEPL